MNLNPVLRLERVGRAAQVMWEQVLALLSFVGEITLAMLAGCGAHRRPAVVSVGHCGGLPGRGPTAPVRCQHIEKTRRVLAWRE
jgi:hypothetical protein